MRRSTSRASASAARRTSSNPHFAHDADVHVDAARPRRLREARQAVLVEHLADAPSRRCANGVEQSTPGLRVEVDAQLVGMVDVPRAHRPRVEVEAPEVHRPDEVRRRRSGTARSRVRPLGNVDGDGLATSRARFVGTRFWKKNSPSAPLG